MNQFLENDHENTREEYFVNQDEDYLEHFSKIKDYCYSDNLKENLDELISNLSFVIDFLSRKEKLNPVEFSDLQIVKSVIEKISGEIYRKVIKKSNDMVSEKDDNCCCCYCRI